MLIPSNPDDHFSFVSPCNREEADTRIFLHARNMSMKDNEIIVIGILDTDFLVLKLTAFTHLVDKVD